MTEIDRALLDRAKARRKACVIEDPTASDTPPPAPKVTIRPSVLDELAEVSNRVDRRLVAGGFVKVGPGAIGIRRPLPWNAGIRDAAEMLDHVGRELAAGRALREDLSFALHRWEDAWIAAIAASGSAP